MESKKTDMTRTRQYVNITSGSSKARAEIVTDRRESFLSKTTNTMLSFSLISSSFYIEALRVLLPYIYRRMSAISPTATCRPLPDDEVGVVPLQH